jgi:hypothetical protein
MTMEERYREMRAAGIVDPELSPVKTDRNPADHQGRRKGA